MFESEQQFYRAVRYYYGLWDKICQRAEVKNYAEIVSRVWDLSEKVWSRVSQLLPHSTKPPVNHLKEEFKEFALTMDGV